MFNLKAYYSDSLPLQIITMNLLDSLTNGYSNNLKPEYQNNLCEVINIMVDAISYYLTQIMIQDNLYHRLCASSMSWQATAKR